MEKRVQTLVSERISCRVLMGWWVSSWVYRWWWSVATGIIWMMKNLVCTFGTVWIYAWRFLMCHSPFFLSVCNRSTHRWNLAYVHCIRLHRVFLRKRGNHTVSTGKCVIPACIVFRCCFFICCNGVRRYFFLHFHLNFVVVVWIYVLEVLQKKCVFEPVGSCTSEVW